MIGARHLEIIDWLSYAFQDYFPFRVLSADYDNCYVFFRDRFIACRHVHLNYLIEDIQVVSAVILDITYKLFLVFLPQLVLDILHRDAYYVYLIVSYLLLHYIYVTIILRYLNCATSA